MIESEFLEVEHQIVRKLKQIPALKVFDDKDFQGLMRLSKIRKYSSGEYIIKENTKDSWIFFLISGSVNVEKKGVVLTSINEAGEVFGEMAIIDDSERSASVIAREHTICLASDVSFINFLEGIEKFRFGYFLFQTLAKIIVKRLRLGNESRVGDKGDGQDIAATIPPDGPGTKKETNASLAGFSNENLGEAVSLYHEKSIEAVFQDIKDCKKSDEYVILIYKDKRVRLHGGDVIGRQGVGRDQLAENYLISRFHSRIIFIKNLCYVEDLNSKNGTFVNGHKLRALVPKEIKKGDEIILAMNKKGRETFLVEHYVAKKESA